MKALYVCFGCLSNTGRLTGLGGLKAVEKVGLDKTNIFCLPGLAVNVPTTIEKSKTVEKIICVDGCSMECAKKVVEFAGFKCDKSIQLVRDLEITKSKPLDYTDEDLDKVTNYIVESINNT